jgi:hypothetical protein
VRQLTTTSPNICTETKEKFDEARNWIISNRCTVFPDRLQLALHDFPEILHDTPEAIFTDSDVQKTALPTR